jgi:hypothetical protein
LDPWRLQLVPLPGTSGQRLIGDEAPVTFLQSLQGRVSNGGFTRKKFCISDRNNYEMINLSALMVVS